MKQTLRSNVVIIAITIAVTLFFAACKNNNATTEVNNEKQVAALLDSFNAAAAKADFNKYFGYYTDDAIFAGTDATERWDKKAFMAWAKPIFDKGHAWNFTALERHIYFDKTGTLAWFDELLNTQMKICRGSGVLVKQDSDWKLQQYILSATIPNDQLDSIIKIKTPVEDPIIKTLQKK
ncbi:nuclear transport factor 2 family protein [Ferruginibacter profundus]